LCINALHAITEGGELKVLLSKNVDAGCVVLEISDTGTGMENETIEKIFNPLFTTKDSEKGTGLGLFVVKQIVDEYQGEIDVKSRPGAGTSFIISLPVSVKT
ncbi:MAG: GHKL domain-containing protein, partial [bacterium]|nr:GHKL domain-containing protein [bacterium]